MKLEKIDHICVAVRDVKKAEQEWNRTFGIQPVYYYVDENEKVNVAQYKIGEVAFELIESTTPDGEVAKFIEKYGEGLYLISFKVPSVPECMRELTVKGLPLMDTEPRKWQERNLTFIHPKSLNGVLIELMD